VIPYLLFGLFALTLLGIATLHKYALQIALSGLGVILLTKLSLTEFDLVEHAHHEWQMLLNLGGLLLGFAILANYFERSELPKKLTEILPGGRLGAFLLLVIIGVLSAVLDNIAAALIGGAAAAVLFKGKVHIGYIAAIVAASNAGGAGSVVGDTTTTMMWIAGASPLWVAEASIGAVVALLFFGFFAARQQHALQPLEKSQGEHVHVDYLQVGIVVLILVGAILANVFWEFPAGGVWLAILVGALVRRPEWKVLGGAAKGMVFLLSLVLCASMMPVEKLPPAGPATAFGLGIVSAFFDNIPLTKLAIVQDGYDWGFLAFTVGFGGSMLWFGSSAGVAISSFFPQAKSAAAWLRAGWHVAVAYMLAFLAMLLLLGWHGQSIESGKDGGHEVPAHPNGSK
jgi:Na+/H+ antiporter NhaD/arsenite permease-like protein